MRRRKPLEAEPADTPVPGSYAFVLGYLVASQPVMIHWLYDLAADREAPASARKLAGQVAHDFRALHEART